jgi:hypothetical protein
MTSIPCADLRVVVSTELRPGDTLLDADNYIGEEDGTVHTSPRGGTALSGDLYGVTEVAALTATVQPLTGGEPRRLLVGANIEALRVLRFPAEAGR